MSLILLAALSVATQPVSRAHALVNEKPRILVLTETKGFRHDAIPEATAALEKLAKERSWTAKSIPAADFPKESGKADVVVFLLTTGDIFDEAGRSALQKFVRGGGGVVGVHSASDTFHGWDWFRRLIGAEFKSHPAIAPAKVVVEDRAHPSSVDLPKDWTRTDEWYDFTANPRSQVRVLASIDESSYPGGTMGDHPILWCQEFEGGRSWYNAMGHTKETYAEKPFLDSLAEGILWTAQGRRPARARPIDWTSTDGWSLENDVLFNKGNARHLVSKAPFGDALVHVEFLLPKGSNSGVYLQGRYEVQIFDSFGKPADQLAFSDAGGIYQRWREKEGTGFEGFAPKVNALRSPGEWNTFDILFRAPRFRSGKKIEDARFVEVRLNGIVVQRDVAVTGPTRAPMSEEEVPEGPILLQGDHGPVSFRNVWIESVRL
jgi:type 1 glutamine amidotransferase